MTIAASDPLPWDIRISTEWEDPPWDEFLRSTELGQYQQASPWARYKACEGWNTHRLLLVGPAGIAGGFQLLWKARRGLRVGYVSKGPVAPAGDGRLEAALARLLAESARRLRLAAVVGQRPDEAGDNPPAYAQNGFVESNPMNVIEATCLADVRDVPDVIRLRMHPKVRSDIRQGLRRGTVVREGTEADLPHFFSLMTDICRRIHTEPNPSSVEALRALWQAFAPGRAVRLTFAVCGDRPVAGKLALHFGHRVTPWKKGWDGTHDDWQPNKVLEDESLAWAHAQGFTLCDYGSLDRLMAMRLLAGDTKNVGIVSGRDTYHLALGTRPRLLPRALLLIVNPLFRWAYRQSYGRVEQRRERRQANSERVSIALSPLSSEGAALSAPLARQRRRQSAALRNLGFLDARSKAAGEPFTQA